MAINHARRAAIIEAAGTTRAPLANDGENISWSRSRFLLEANGKTSPIHFIGVCRPINAMGLDGRKFALFGIHPPQPHLEVSGYAEIDDCAAAVLLTCGPTQGVGYVQKLVRKNGHQHRGEQKHPGIVLHLTGKPEEYRSVVTDYSSYKRTAPTLAIAQPA
jgi:hypothetical protein